MNPLYELYGRRWYEHKPPQTWSELYWRLYQVELGRRPTPPSPPWYTNIPILGALLRRGAQTQGKS